jgi:hypothetical protein
MARSLKATTASGVSAEPSGTSNQQEIASGGIGQGDIGMNQVAKEAASRTQDAAALAHIAADARSKQVREDRTAIDIERKSLKEIKRLRIQRPTDWGCSQHPRDGTENVNDAA